MTLHETDRQAKAEGVALTDSAMRSLLVRAINEARGKPAKTAPSSARDRGLADTLRRLAEVRASLRVVVGEEAGEPIGSEGDPLPTAEWIHALQAVKESCEARTGGEPGSRGYLDFLTDFLRDAMKRAGHGAEEV